MESITFRTPLALLLLSLSAIAAVWWWLATPISLSRAPIDPNAKLMCVSYAPFRGDQTPLSPMTHISAEQISEDLAQLAGSQVGAFQEVPHRVKRKSLGDGRAPDERKVAPPPARP